MTSRAPGPGRVRTKPCDVDLIVVEALRFIRHSGRQRPIENEGIESPRVDGFDQTRTRSVDPTMRSSRWEIRPALVPCRLHGARGSSRQLARFRHVLIANDMHERRNQAKMPTTREDAGRA